MKTTLNKSIKRALSLCLAFAVVIGSLFVANVGVNINASAEITENNCDVWDGSISKPTELDDAGNIIIRTAEEFAWVALSNEHTTEKRYKVADGIKYFNMNGKENITPNSTAAEVKAAKTTGKNWVYGDYTSADRPNFRGTVDGNGVIIYNIYAQGGGYAALFPYILNSGASDNPRHTATFKNINVKASQMSAYHGVGGIIGYDPGYPTTITVEGCSVTDCYLFNTGTSDATYSIVGGIAAYVMHDSTIINNCYVGGNILEATKIVSGFIGNCTNNASTIKISNSICIDALPYATKVGGSAEPNTKVTTGATYTNVYTNQSFNSASYPTIKTVVSGADAVTQMPLDFTGTWFANTTTYPQLRSLHNFDTNYVDEQTHTEICSDCGLSGVPSAHFYNTLDKVYNQSVCACGARIDGLFDVWDAQGAIDSDFEGEGTAEEPYIINTVEELYGMVRSSGVDANGNALYYKVADGVSSLYINDTRAITQDQFNTAATAGSLYNWSDGLTREGDICDHTSCIGCNGGTSKYTSGGFVDYFGGKFDGNGATIYGLYSKTTNVNYAVSGVGFVPMLTGDATIKNVVFDTNYIENTSGFAAVISASVGFWDAQYKSDGVLNMCENVYARAKFPADCNATIMNTAVRNAYIKTTVNGLTDGQFGQATYTAGLVTALNAPNSIKFINCLFDGTNSSFVTTDGYNEAYAGIYSSRQGYNGAFIVDNCLTINGNNIANVDAVSALRYDVITTDLAHNTYSYGIAANNTTLGTLKANGYTSASDLPLLNWTAWDNSDAVIAKYGTPMPKLYNGWEFKDFRYYKDAFKNSEWYAFDSSLLPYGTSVSDSNSKGYQEGVFSDYDELMGSGTEADPYIIDNAQMLFEVIASGGTLLGVPQHFKLACDIDLGGVQWVCHQTERDISPKVYYVYNAFGGVIDGDGHTITGMYTGTNDTNAGFIPELASTGVVKNLHFRNSYARTTGGAYGVIAGKTASGSKIEGCSVDGGVADVIAGDSNATITNSYCGEGVTTATGELFDGTNYDTAVWYKGGAEGSKYLLLNKALSMPYADIDGDGDGYDYGAEDISALKNKLLRQPAYANIYGDVSRNGKTDIRDLVILQREIDPDDLIVELDGFWKNVKAGNFKIWYDENDNYDAARKLQLYLQEETGVNVAKDIGAGDGMLDIVVKNDTGLAASKYSVAYDIENAVLTISGGSFTAIEQAVIDFANSSDAASGVVFTVTGKDIPSTKASIDVYTYNTSNDNGSTSNTSAKTNKGTYYYVWGDEFDESVDGTISYDKWNVRDQGGDTNVGTSDSSDFANLKLANDKGLKLLNVVDGGKLTMRRGVGDLSPKNAGYASELSYTADIDGNRIAFDDNDMASSGLLYTKNSLLFKYGYAEMQATIPNDKNAFPAWWLLSSGGRNNLDISRSLYSKVYPINEYYSDSRPLYYSSADAYSYEYQLPTYTYEIDVFEIINNGSIKNKLYYNLHKWYAYSKSTQSTKASFDVYDLNWSEITESNNKFSKKLLSTSYSNGTMSVTDSKIFYHQENYKDSQINVAINEFGAEGLTSKTYGKVDGEKEYWWEKGTNYDINMITNISGTSVTYKFGFLWTDTEMTYILKDTNGNLVSSVTINLADLDFDKNTNILPEQYVYFLIDNHFYTKGSTVTTAGDMTIDYIRLYQLDGKRDIVTPETEAFNSHNRFN